MRKSAPKSAKRKENENPETIAVSGFFLQLQVVDANGLEPLTPCTSSIRPEARKPCGTRDWLFHVKL